MEVWLNPSSTTQTCRIRLSSNTTTSKVIWYQLPLLKDMKVKICSNISTRTNTTSSLRKDTKLASTPTSTPRKGPTKARVTLYRYIRSRTLTWRSTSNLRIPTVNSVAWTVSASTFLTTLTAIAITRQPLLINNKIWFLEMAGQTLCTHQCPSLSSPNWTTWDHPA